MNDDPKYLNALCPYCGRLSRIGMIHECEKLPQGYGWVELRWKEDRVVAIAFG